MQAAKDAARNFLHRDRHHETSVCETYKPAVTKETIVPVEKVEEIVAVDREIHQDHHQTRIQPVEDRVREAERHEHNVLPVEHREHHHGKDAEVKRRLEQEAQQFKSTITVLPTTHEKVAAETVRGEHIHHHVHETVQPVIEREVIQPTVIHTTVPIHERIEHEPTFHPATVQPKMTMEEFRRAGGTLEGHPEVCDVFEGEPQIKENGGASQTYPNAMGSRRGHRDHNTNPATTAAATAAAAGTRPPVARVSSSSSDARRPPMARMSSSSSDVREKLRGHDNMQSGMRTPPIGTH